MELAGQDVIPTLRPYQVELRDRLTQAAADGHRRLLCQSWMGSGKTVLASRIAVDAVKNGKNVLWLVHRRELVFQADAELRAAGGDPAIMISGDPYDSSKSLIVASIQTLYAWCIRRKKEDHPPANLVITDECHHATASTYVAIHELYPDAILLGLTATPMSKSGKGLASHYDIIVPGPPIKTLLDDGYLVPIDYRVPSIPDLAKIKVSAGDFSAQESEKALDRPELVGDIVSNWTRFAANQPTLVFSSGISHSRNIVSEFKKIGADFRHIDAKTPKSERDEALSLFKSGKISGLSNVGIYTEGTDIPCAAALIFARPTMSECLYLQTVGRIMRTFPGKEKAILLDHAGVVYTHGKIEEERNFYLTHNAEKPVEIRKRIIKRKKLSIICKQCDTYYEPKERKSMVCPSCGYTPEINGKPMSSVQGWLTSLTAKDKESEYNARKKIFYKLKNYATLNGYKPGWAACRFKSKFGSWPPWHWWH